MLKVVYCQIVVAIETNQIVLIALVITHKEVLAVYAAIVMPPAFRLLYRLAFGVIVASIGDIVFTQVLLHLRLSFTLHFSTFLH